MTEAEAITHLQNISEIIPGYCRSQAFSVAISALEKQIPKKPVKMFTVVNDLKAEFTVCPNCQIPVDVDFHDFCPACGQSLEWE